MIGNVIVSRGSPSSEQRLCSSSTTCCGESRRTGLPQPRQCSTAARENSRFAIPTKSTSGPAPICYGADSLRCPQPMNSTKQFHYFILPNYTRLLQYSWPRPGRTEPDLTWARPDPEGPPKEQFEESESY